MSRKRVYLSLGSNLGEREEHLERAIAALEKDEIRVITRSSLYETEPQDFVQQPWFLNMALECETRYFPVQFLMMLQAIERDLGRVRAGAVRRGPRIIDIDILLFANSVIDSGRLVIPHPRMLERRFMLEPLLEIAPDIKHPATREPLSRYLNKVAGQKVKRRDLGIRCKQA